MTFLSAGLLGGLLLATVPIIIHILNRRRFQVIDWPPMKYLKLTLKKNRKRIRIEQMILLAMRVLAVVLLILAVARPVISQGSLSKLMPGKARVSRVIVIDDSLSMGYTTAGRTAFEMAQQAASEVIKNAGGQDALTLVVTSAPERPLVKEASMQDGAKYAGMVAGLRVTDTANHWGETLEAVRTALGAATFSNKEVVILTDLRASGWGGGKGDEDVTRAANELAAERVPVRIIDVGDRRTENVALTNFELEDAIPLPDQPMHLMATIENKSASAVENGQAILSVDGDNRPVLLPTLTGGGTTEVPLTVTVTSPGAHTLALSLAKDALPADGTRYLAVTVRPTVSVLLVDGAPSAQAFESETDFLALAYSVGARPWNAQRVGELDVRHLLSGASGIPDVVVLANVPSLTGEQVSGLEKLVEKGMGLMIFTGDQVDAEAWNGRVYRGGKGLLPARLDRVAETPTGGIAIEKDAQSPLAAMGKLLPAALARVRTRQYTTVEGGGAVLGEGVSVLARWNNAENPPAVMEKVFGKGRVLLFTTTAGKKWTDWPLDPTYVLGMRSAALGIARSQELGGSVEAGEKLRLTFEAGKSVLDPHVTTGESKTPESVEVETVNGGGTNVTYEKTVRAGIYTVSWRDEKSKPMSAQFAVNPPVAESALEPLTEAQLAGLMGNLKPVVQRYDVKGIGADVPPRELWRPLATILLFLMAAEAAFAAWVGRER
jgi:hypothetical protein